MTEPERVNDAGERRGWERVCQESELPPGARKRIRLGALELLLYNSGGTLYASDARCPHLGEPLDKGELQGCVVRCNAHGYRLDLSNGKCLTEPGLEFPVFPVEAREGWIWVRA